MSLLDLISDLSFFLQVASQFGRTLEDLEAEQRERILRGGEKVKRSVAVETALTSVRTCAFVVGDFVRNIPRAGYNISLGLLLGRCVCNVWFIDGQP